MKASRIISAALAGIMAVSAFGITASAATVKKPKTIKAANTAKGVKLTWSKVKGKGVKYKVYKGGKLIKTVKKATYTDTKISSGTTVTYKVKAAIGKITSKAASVKTTFLKKPTMKGVEIKENGYEVSWKITSGATKYVLYKKAQGAKKYTKLVTTKKNSYTDTKVKTCKTISYKVKAYDPKTKSYSVFSKAVKTTPFLSTPVLTKRYYPTADGVITLEWAPVEGATGYRVARAYGALATKFDSVTTVSETKLTEKFEAKPTMVVYSITAIGENDAESAPTAAVGIIIPENTYYTDSEKNLNVNLDLKVGDEYKDGATLVAYAEVTKFADETQVYTIDVVEGNDVITVKNGVINAVKAGSAKIKITLPKITIDVFNSYLDQVRQASDLKFSNRLETGVVYVNVNVA